MMQRLQGLEDEPTRTPTLAIVGAGGLVGAHIAPLLSLRAFDWGAIKLFASERAVGRMLSVRGTRTRIEKLYDGCFDDVDVVIFATPAEPARLWAQRAVAAGCLVVDGSGAHTDDPDTPIVVPSVNAWAATDLEEPIVAVPAGLTTTLADALGVLHANWGLERVFASTYEAASLDGGVGVQRLMAELQAVVEFSRHGAILGQRPGDVRAVIADALGEANSPFVGPLALNVLPQLGPVMDSGLTFDEATVAAELRRVLALPDLGVSVVRVVVPILTGQCATVHAVCDRRVKLPALQQAFMEAPDVVLMDASDGDLPTPVDVAGLDPAFVGRLHQDPARPREVRFFIAGDNVRRGAALALVRVAELVASRLVPSSLD